MKKINLFTDDTDNSVDMQYRPINEELAISFHEQFAQNQNHHQNLFLQVITVLLTVMIGFGYLYVRVGASEPELNITPSTLSYFLVLSMALLSLASAMILNMSLGFRRDQMVSCNIRIMSGAMSLDENEITYLPSGFNPINKVGKYDWMPEFHKIFFFALLIVKLIFISSVLFNSQLIDFRETEIGYTPIILVIVSTISIWSDFKVKKHYRKKWLEYTDNALKTLKNSTTNKVRS